MSKTGNYCQRLQHRQRDQIILPTVSKFINLTNMSNVEIDTLIMQSKIR